MCVVKKPKVAKTQEKEPIVIRNPLLDGQDPATKALRQGRSSLRIEPGIPSATTALSSVAGVSVNPAPSAVSAAPAATGSRSGWVGPQDFLQKAQALKVRLKGF